MSVLLSSSIIRESGVKFGTSGARGLVTQFTDEVCAAFTCAFIECLKVEFRFNRIAIAIDNRPSSYRMAQACAAAAKLNRIDVEYYGVIPTPALAYTSMQDKVPCIMVTGSHIPFDRNGLKFYRPDGEISKVDEQRILSLEIEVPELNEFSELKVRDKAAQQYMNRYTTLFSEDLLAGKRIGIYEHSSSGRDLYPVLFEALGAEVISLERTDEFVPIDTEAVSEADKSKPEIGLRNTRSILFFLLMVMATGLWSQTKTVSGYEETFWGYFVLRRSRLKL
ncbi:phosphomannomutase [Vibrio ishigakensis]|uniref:Phosphomannomutase n=1 Tax=Vibrio ishigakensis TaxID=1481914 RepID=A0A0B8P944_9VIBR|nr:phosphomannomutase [Vibrio ishigakensis]